MNIQTPRPAGHQSWEEVRTRLDQIAPFSNMYDTPYYRDASTTISPSRNTPAATRRCATRCASTSSTAVIVPGGPSHWSFGGGMQWLTGHWEWHAISLLRAGAARRRADADLLHGRHPCRGRAAANVANRR